MDATEKAKWTEEAAKDKERFSKENAAYMAEKNPTPVVVDETIQPDDNAPATGKETLEKIVAIVETVATKVEDAAGSVMESRDTAEMKQADAMEVEASEVQERHEVSSKKSTEERSNLKVGAMPKESKGKSGIKSKKVATVKEQGGSSGDGSGEIPPQVANYFAFLFSRWAGTRQV